MEACLPVQGSSTMDAARAGGRSAGNTSYEVLLRATIATRFRVRDRWVIAASFSEEAAARREFAALGREFPHATVSLRLVRSDADEASGHYRERVLDSRDGQARLGPRGHPRLHGPQWRG
jgi:hypothetical protein